MRVIHAKLYGTNDSIWGTASIFRGSCMDDGGTGEEKRIQHDNDSNLHLQYPMYYLYKYFTEPAQLDVPYE